VRVIESSLLGPAAVGMQLADLGAEVIKIEGPGGDYVRKMAFPIIDGVSLLHWHLNRGKKSIVLDLRKPEAWRRYLRLVRGADAVIEAMRPGALGAPRHHLGSAAAANPRIVFCQISGYGMTGPYKDMPSHGIAYDAWAGVARRRLNAEGQPTIPSYTPIGINAGPLYAALGICAAIIRAAPPAGGAASRLRRAMRGRASTGTASRATRRTSAPRTRSPATTATARAAPPGRRRQHDRIGALSVLPLARRSRAVHGVRARVLEELRLRRRPPGAVRRQPGAKYADHARGNVALAPRLGEIFATRTTAEWVRFGLEVNTPIAPVNDYQVDHPRSAVPRRLPLAPGASGHRPHAVADQAARRANSRSRPGRRRARPRHRRRTARGPRL
jgi:crotonobetainyl-CoA:carnitine CoA-transferase CaiB-like acyl-CoA transferase